MKFDLFRLHMQDEDTKPKSWVCFKGRNLHTLIDKLIDEIINKTPPEEYIELNPRFRFVLFKKLAKIGSQRKVAKIFGWRQQTISEWKLGIHSIPISILRQIILLLKVNWETVEKHIVRREPDLKTGANRWRLSIRFSKQLKCSPTTIFRIISKKELYPVPFILELVLLWKQVAKKTEQDVKLFLQKVQNETEFLKVNNPASKQIKAVKDLTEALCKIAGAHAADGNLSLQLTFSSLAKGLIDNLSAQIAKSLRKQPTVKWDETRNCWAVQLYISPKKHAILKRTLKLEKGIWVSLNYKMILQDEYKRSVKAFCNWLKDVFNIKVFPQKSKDKKEWHVVVQNKIFARYLYVFLRFPYTKKTFLVKEPSIIKRAGFNFRKAFAIGVLTFDGSTNLMGELNFSTKSKLLFNSIFEIISTEIQQKYFDHGVSKRNEFYFRNNKLTDNLIVKLSEYLEPHTEKWMKLIEYVNGFCLKPSSFDEVKNVFDAIDHGKVKFGDILDILQKLGPIDVRFLQKIIQERVGRRISTQGLRDRLTILKKSGVVLSRQDKIRHRTGAVYRHLYELNSDDSAWRIPTVYKSV